MHCNNPNHDFSREDAIEKLQAEYCVDNYYIILAMDELDPCELDGYSAFTEKGDLKQEIISVLGKMAEESVDTLGGRDV